MLHPVLKWGWRVIWTIIAILLMIAGFQAEHRPVWVVVVVVVLGWAVLMAFPNFYNWLYDWIKAKSDHVRFRRTLIVAPFAAIAMFWFITQIIGLAVWLGVAGAVLFTGLWLYVSAPTR